MFRLASVIFRPFYQKIWIPSAFLNILIVMGLYVIKILLCLTAPDRLLLYDYLFFTVLVVAIATGYGLGGLGLELLWGKDIFYSLLPSTPALGTTHLPVQ
jgi:hypothetical protein